MILRDLVPTVLAAVGIDGEPVQHGFGPGGFKLRVNPSLQIHATITDEHAEILAAALGWTFRQSSVLVADLRDSTEARTGYVIVDFGEGNLAPAAAEAFFRHGANLAPGLGEGFTAFNGDMLYLNVRAPNGRHYSNLEDHDFAAALRRAAKSFSTGARVAEVGIADARFVENDWSHAEDGQSYLAKLGRSADMARLHEVRTLHTEFVRAAVSKVGSQHDG
ncbi:MAG: hypothetical protein AAF581_20210 [Planctomycetota bacterium]